MEPGRDHELEEDMFDIIREGPLEGHENNSDDFTSQFLNESGDGLEGPSDEIDVPDSAVGKSSGEVYISHPVFVYVE
jgi:hypothetical protein